MNAVENESVSVVNASGHVCAAEFANDADYVAYCEKNGPHAKFEEYIRGQRASGEVPLTFDLYMFVMRPIQTEDAVPNPEPEPESEAEREQRLRRFEEARRIDPYFIANPELLHGTEGTCLNETDDTTPPVPESNNLGATATLNGAAAQGKVPTSPYVVPGKNLIPYEVLSSSQRGASGLTDLEVYQRASQSKNGSNFTKNWVGILPDKDRKFGAEAFAARREAWVMGLVRELAFWTGNDVVQIDRMFRVSGLMSPAWDAEGPAGTYGKGTIDLIIRHSEGTYRPSAGGRRGEPATEPKSLAVTTLSDVPMRPLRWLVPGYFPLGKLVLLAGEGGDGKSLLTIETAARVTRGATCLGMDYQASPPAEALLISCEDDVADTIVPRLAAAGADLTRVHHVEGMRDQDGKLMPFNLKHYALLENELNQRPDVRLVVIDPAGAYIGGGTVDDYKETDLRSLLGPLSTLAAKTNVTVILVKHFGKAPTARAVHKVLGSVAYVNTVRAAFVTARDVDQPERRFLLPLKFNLGVMPPGLAFTVESVSDVSDQQKILQGIKSEDIDLCVNLSEQFTRIKWLGPVDITADEAVALSARGHRDGPSRVEACTEWLRRFLGEFAYPAQEIQHACQEAGFTFDNLKNAKAALKDEGLVNTNQGIFKGTWWSGFGPESTWKQRPIASSTGGEEACGTDHHG